MVRRLPYVPYSEQWNAQLNRLPNNLRESVKTVQGLVEQADDSSKNGEITDAQLSSFFELLYTCMYYKKVK